MAIGLRALPLLVAGLISACGTQGDTRPAAPPPAGTAPGSAPATPPAGPPTWRLEVPRRDDVPPIKRGLIAVWGSGRGDVYAVGVYGTILHTADGGEAWEPRHSGTTENLNAIWG